MGFLNNPCLGNCIKEETQEVIPYTLPPTNLLISLLPAPQLDVVKTIWKGPKVYKHDTRKKKKTSIYCTDSE